MEYIHLFILFYFRNKQALEPTKVELVEADEILVLEFAETLLPGIGVLAIRFEGVLNDKMKGFYRRSFILSSFFFLFYFFFFHYVYKILKFFKLLDICMAMSRDKLKKIIVILMICCSLSQLKKNCNI